MKTLVTITPEEAARAERKATAHFKRAVRESFSNLSMNQQDEKRRFQMAAAYRAEYAAARWFGVTLKLDKPDVGRYSVRYGSRPNHGLVIYDYDKDHPYMLVVPGGRTLEFEIVGWLTAAEARELRESGFGFAIHEHAWCIPQSRMRPLSELGRESVA